MTRTPTERWLAIGPTAPMPGDTVPGWTTPEERRNATRAYESDLARRFLAGEPLSKTDKRHARKVIKAGA